MTVASDSKKRLISALVKVPLVRSMKVKGRWMGSHAAKIDRKAIVESLRREREDR
jgi:hypothetical protein